MITTYAWGHGAVAHKFSDEAGWLESDPSSPLKWKLPHATNLGTLAAHVGPVTLSWWLAIHDGVIDHAAFDSTGGRDVYREAANLRREILGLRVGDVAARLRDLPATARKTAKAPQMSAAELARSALAAALANAIDDGAAL